MLVGFCVLSYLLCLDGVMKDFCLYFGFFRGLCIMCGTKIDDGVGVVFGYIYKVLFILNKVGVYEVLWFSELCNVY